MEPIPQVQSQLKSTKPVNIIAHFLVSTKKGNKNTHKPLTTYPNHFFKRDSLADNE